MKRTAIYLTTLAIVPMMISSCRVYDSKEYMEEPAYLLAQAAYKNFVNPLLKSAELADFFARYQEIRSDREAALALADTYFPGGWGISELYYEMAAGYYGDIYLEDDGSFLVIPTWGMYYLSCSGVLSCDIYDIGFSVVPEGDRRYSNDRESYGEHGFSQQEFQGEELVDIEEGQDEEELDFNDEDFTIDFDEMSDEE